jgi:peptidoglycan/LPS O-acetylase OafA/YrhL
MEHGIVDHQAPRIEALDALRGIAAALIVFVHVFALNHIELPGYLPSVAPYLLLGVEMFFVLSAFSLCLGYFGKLETSAQMSDYFIRRLFRIAPLWYFLLAIWIVVMSIYFVPPTAGAVFLNATFLFGLLPNGQLSSIVWAGWSIGVEMLFYVIFPLLLLVTTNIKRTAIALAFSVVAAICIEQYLIGLGLPKTPRYVMLHQLPLFISGILAFHVYRSMAPLSEAARRARGKILFFLSLAALLVFCCASGKPLVVNGITLYRYVAGLCFAGMILGLALWPAAIIVNRLTVWAGVRGYSIYLLHPLAVYFTIPFVQSAIYGGNVKSGDWLPLALSFGLVLLITLAASAFTYRWVEQPGVAQGRRAVARPRAVSSGRLPAPATPAF